MADSVKEFNQTICASLTTTDEEQTIGFRTVSVESIGSTIFENPAEYDILCGQDKTWANWKGNTMFRKKVLMFANDYYEGNKQTKMRLTRMIVESVKKEFNSRFIRSIKCNITGKQLWEEIDDNKARDKTSHALRIALKHAGHTNHRSRPAKVSSCASSGCASSSSDDEGKKVLSHNVDSLSATNIVSEEISNERERLYRRQQEIFKAMAVKDDEFNLVTDKIKSITSNHDIIQQKRRSNNRTDPFDSGCQFESDVS